MRYYYRHWKDVDKRIDKEYNRLGNKAFDSERYHKKGGRPISLDFCSKQSEDFEYAYYLLLKTIEREERREFRRLCALKKALKLYKDFDPKSYSLIREFYFDDMTYTSAAKLHGISRQAYTKKLSHALDKLRDFTMFFFSYYDEE